MMATQELVVPKSIPMTSPASVDLKRRATESKTVEDAMAPGEARAAMGATDRRSSILEANIIFFSDWIYF